MTQTYVYRWSVEGDLRRTSLIVDVDQPLRRPITAVYAFMNPNSITLALKSLLQGNTQNHLQILNTELKAKMKLHQMPKQ
ncbi:hypothetical protein RYX36_008500, partial [Vicia faba]